MFRRPRVRPLTLAALLLSLAAAPAPAADPISPAGAGRKTTTLPVSVQSAGGITTWEFRIAAEGTGTVLRRLVGTGDPPESISWDGRDDAGRAVPDGRYLYVLEAADASSHKSFSEEKSVQADSTVPTARLSVEALPSTAVLTLTTQDTGSGIASWQVAIANAAGGTIRTFSGQGVPPQDLVWDLRDASGKAVGSGSFAARLSVEDAAGNSASADPAPIDLATASKGAPASFGIKSMAVAPDGQSVTNVTFQTKQLKSAALKSWALEIRDPAGIVVRKFEGKGMPPPSLSWDGKNADGQVVPEGIKSKYTMKVVPAASGEADPQPLAVKVDAALAAASAEISTAVFRFQLDAAQVERWVLDIARPTGEVAYRYEGRSDLPSQVTWDGRDERGEKVPDAVFCRYLMRVYAKDGRVLAATNPMSIATLTRVARHLVIPGVQFGLARFELLAAGRERLDSAVEFLLANPSTDVLIEGHSCSLGARHVNLLLSHKRAQAVYSYVFEEKSCRAAKVRVKAVADSRSLAPNDTEEGRAMNRRAEVYLTKRVD